MENFKTNAILIDDISCWYTINGSVKNACKQFNVYSHYLDNNEINNILDHMIKEILDNFNVDVVFIPLMAGVILGKKVIEYFWKQNNVPVFFIPISRHPWVSWNLDFEDSLMFWLHTYSNYAKRFLIDINNLQIRKEKVCVLLFDEAIDEGNIMYSIIKLLDEKIKVDKKFIIATLINEVSSYNISPNGVMKRVQPDIWGLEAKCNTRNVSHYLNLLKPYQQESNNKIKDIYYLWDILAQKSKEFKEIYNMFEKPHFFSHENIFLRLNEKQKMEMYKEIYAEINAFPDYDKRCNYLRNYY